ncbi:hypothetical protein RJ55_05045 [Drechmeria coniospora]|nr:hypothetical protein RJ55_05045 [Drechmeria coniospora]
MSPLPDAELNPCQSARFSGINRRYFVIPGLVFLAVLVFGSARLITSETSLSEQRSHDKRQFQLGGMLGGYVRQPAKQTLSQETTGVQSSILSATASRQPDPLSSRSGTWRESHATPQNSMQPFLSGVATEPEPTSMGDITGTDQGLGSSKALLEALTEALRKAIGTPGQLTEAAAANPISIYASGRFRSAADGLSLAAAARTLHHAASPFRPAGHEASLRGADTQSEATTASRPNLAHEKPEIDLFIGLLGGLGELASMQHGSRGQTDAPSGPKSVSEAPSKGVLSMLSPLSNFVAQVAGVDAGAAAKLADVVLNALPVDASAVAASLPQVTGQASVKMDQLLPLILPAVASVLGQEIAGHTAAVSNDVMGTMDQVVSQGMSVMNQMTSSLKSTTDARLQAILDQVAVVVYAAANCLNKPICAVSHTIQGVAVEAVMPCSAACTDPVSANIVTLNPGMTPAAGSVTLQSPSGTLAPLIGAPAHPFGRRRDGNNGCAAD